MNTSWLKIKIKIENFVCILVACSIKIENCVCILVACYGYTNLGYIN